MQLQHLYLRGFRSHADTALTFDAKVNLLYGPNGAGKTNILEAIHYLCLTKSFLASSDTYVLQKGADFFEVRGQFEGDQRPQVQVRVAYVPNEGKRIFVNGAPLERLADIVGQVPVVVFSPDDQAITAGGPDERRRLLNNILSQDRPVYLDDLLKYRRALRQRNELLSQQRGRRPNPAMDAALAAWDAEILTLGSRVVHRRLRFLATFAQHLRDAYRHIDAAFETPGLRYQSIGSLPRDADLATVEARYAEQMEAARSREREQGRTLLGPHRDEIIFTFDDMEVRRYASQGQHRTFGMALKLAQYFYLQERLEERPILLLDDVFGNFDPERAADFLNLLQSDSVGQSIITATQREPFAEHIPFGTEGHRAQPITRRAAPSAAPTVAPASVSLESYEE